MRRRKFIFTSVSAAGGIAIGGYYLAQKETVPNPLLDTLAHGELAITPYVFLDIDGVTIIAPRAEMGQGIHGTLALLVAEELDVPFSQIRVIHGPLSKVYANNVAYPKETTLMRMLRRGGKIVGWEKIKEMHPQLTGGQSSTKDGFVKMRKAGAAARMVLLKAAAQQYDVKVDALRTSQGKVVLPNDTAIPYTALLDHAKDIAPPTDPLLKPRREWQQLGRSQPRVDMISKCTGTAKFGIDVRLPEMLYATVKFNPHIGSKVKWFDDSKAKSMPGFVKAIAKLDGIIVIATNTWYAMQAAKAIDVEWESALYPTETAAHREVVSKAILNEQGGQVVNDGNVDAAFSKSEIIEGTYHVPYLAHAAMEPQNAVAMFKNGQLDIWAGHQQPGKAQHLGAKIAGIFPQAVKMHTLYMGGGFGRRLENDFISFAVHAAVEMRGKPVKVTWSRESDMTHDAYRPMASARFRAALGNATINALALDVASPSLFSSLRRRDIGIKNDVPERLDKFNTAGVGEQPYSIKNYRVTAHKVERLLPVGWFRGVGESQNVFFHDSAIDELAHVANADPFKFRLSHLEHDPSIGVLNAVAQLSNWESSLPKGHARGISYALSSGAATAQVIEVSKKKEGIKIEKVFAAIDVGIALDPRNIEAQVRSSVIFGLGAAMYGEITVSNGKVDQTNFHDYAVLRMNQIPPITVHIHESESKIFGAGESGVPTAAPALGNAIYALTGERLRELPFSKSVTFV